MTKEREALRKVLAVFYTHWYESDAHLEMSFPDYIASSCQAVLIDPESGTVIVRHPVFKEA